MDKFFGFLPNLLGFLVLLIVGFIVAKIVAAIFRKIGKKLGLDQRLHQSPGHAYVERIMPGASPSRGIARVVFWLIFAFFLVSAIGALEIPAATSFMNQVLAYLPNIVVAILIFVVAAILAGAVGAGAMRLMGDTPTGKVVGAAGPALVMVIAVFMILSQLRIAEDIVIIAFAATLGAIALGLALAFGLGGREMAGRMLEDAYQTAQRNKEQVKQDLQAGRERAGEQAQQFRDETLQRAADSGATGDRGAETPPATGR